jgi:hypothetical protein
LSNRYISRGGIGVVDERFRKRRRGRSVIDKPGLDGIDRGFASTWVFSTVSSGSSVLVVTAKGGGGGSIYPRLLSHIRFISPATFTVHTGCVNALERMRACPEFE